MKTIFPVITLYQPWATWIMRGWKTIETREHGRFYSLQNRTILIHAGLKTDSSKAAVENPYLTFDQIVFNPDEMINGFILGSAKVTYVTQLTDRNSKDALIDCGTTRRFGLFLEDVVKFEKPIECKGEMGIWYYDLSERKKVRKSEITQTLTLL